MTPLQIILYWPIIILIKTLVDFWQHKTGRKIKHGIEFWAMVFVAFFYQVAAGIRREEQWELAGFILMYQFFSYVALHDLLINTWMGKGPLFIGTTAWWDVHVWHRWPNFYTWSKIIALILSIISAVWINEEIL